MIRFSPKQLLSNIVTPVRGGVDFAVFVKSVAVLFLIALTGSYSSAKDSMQSSIALEELVSKLADKDKKDKDEKVTFEQQLQNLEQMNSKLSEYCNQKLKDGEDNPKYNLTSCQNVKSLMGEFYSRRDEACRRENDKLEKLAADAKESCANAGFGSGLRRCFEEVKRCDKAEENLAALTDEDEGGEENYCNRILANACPAIPTFSVDRDYRAEKKDAERDRKDAKKDVDDLMSDERELRADMAKQQREIQEEAQKQQFEQRKREREISSQMKDAFDNITENQKKQFEDAQKAYAEMDAAYIKMRKDTQSLVDAVSQAEDDLQVTCRAAAEKKYQEAEKARLAAQAQLAGKRKNVGTNVAGTAKRKKAQATLAKNIDYSAFFNECVNGVSAEGAGARSKIKTAQRAKESNDKFLKEQATMIESERAKMLKKLQGLEEEGKTQQSKVIEKVNEKIADMNEEMKMIAQQNQARITEFQQSSSAKMQAIQQKIQTANQELVSTQQEAAVATNRISCLGKSAQWSESKRDKVEKGFKSAVPDIERVRGVCKSRDDVCPGEARTPAAVKSNGGTLELDSGDICTFVKDIIEKAPVRIKTREHNTDSSTSRQRSTK